LKQARECLAEAKAALALPKPSTFLGARQKPPSTENQNEKEGRPECPGFAERDLDHGST
jgi:hypothetical protein